MTKKINTNFDYNEEVKKLRNNLYFDTIYISTIKMKRSDLK